MLAAANVDLWQRFHEGRFREDLLWRLEGVVVVVPALDEREEDAAELATAFGSALQPPVSFTRPALGWLVRRGWPGNVRELKRAVERVALLSGATVVDVADLVEHVGPARRQPDEEERRAARGILDVSGQGSKVRRSRDAAFREALERTGWRQADAAKLLGVSRNVVHRWCKRLAAATADMGDAP